MLMTITWDVSPEIFQIGSLAIRWYGLLFALSFFLGYLIMLKIFRREGVPDKLLDELTTYMIIGTIIGARLGHVFFYEASWYLAHPVKIFKVWEGGLASHGAAIGIILALIIFARIKKRSFFWVIDRIVIVVALAGFLIRMGNLMNSEIYGVQTNLPWGFFFVRSSTPEEGLVPRHPTQIYEGLAYLVSFFILLWYYDRKKGKPSEGFLFGLFLVLIFGIRFFVEFLKEPQVGFEQNMTLNMGQLLSLPFIATGAVLMWMAQRGMLSRRKP